MGRRDCQRAIAAAGLALVAAEAGVRLLRPSEHRRPTSAARLEDHFSAAEIARGRRFARPQAALGLARGAVELGALAAMARRPPRWPRLARHPLAAGAAVATELTLALSLAGLPLGAASRRRAMAVGLLTQSWRGWAADLLKGIGIEAALAASGGAAVVAVSRRWPRHWWAVAGGGSAVVGAGFAALAPVVLDPVFNDFEPLPEGQTRSDVLALASAAGVRVGEVYSVDASRRTTAANAYVTGLGPTKRVVLFDTLLDRYDRDEVRTVVAHELAHVRHRDVLRGVAYAALVGPVVAFGVSRVAAAPPTPGSLPALALTAAVVSAPVGMTSSRLSRAIERRADAFALALAGAPEAFIAFERRIALQNVADLDPPRWLTALTATHPPTAERIGLALTYAKPGAGSSPPP